MAEAIFDITGLSEHPTHHIADCSFPPPTFNHEGRLQQINANSKKVFECHPAQIDQVDSKNKDLGLG